MRVNPPPMISPPELPSQSQPAAHQLSTGAGAVDPAEGSASADPLAEVQTTDEMGNDLTLSDVLENFQQAAYSEDNHSFIKALMQVRKIRNQTFGIDDTEALLSAVPSGGGAGGRRGAGGAHGGDMVDTSSLGRTGPYLKRGRGRKYGGFF